VFNYLEVLNFRGHFYKSKILKFDVHIFVSSIIKMAMNQQVSLGDVNYTDIVEMMRKVASKEDSEDPISLNEMTDNIVELHQLKLGTSNLKEVFSSIVKTVNRLNDQNVSSWTVSQSVSQNEKDKFESIKDLYNSITYYLLFRITTIKKKDNEFTEKAKTDLLPLVKTHWDSFCKIYK